MDFSENNTTYLIEQNTNHFMAMLRIARDKTLDGEDDQAIATVIFAHIAIESFIHTLLGTVASTYTAHIRNLEDHDYLIDSLES